MRRDYATGLDPWPARRPQAIVMLVDETNGWAYAVDVDTNQRILRIPGEIVIQEEVVHRTVFMPKESE